MKEQQPFDITETLSEELTSKQLHDDDPAADDAKKDKTGKAKPHKKASKRRRPVLTAVFVVLLALLIGAAFYFFRILSRPETMFQAAKANVTAEPRKELMEPAFDLSAYANLTPEPEDVAPIEVSVAAASSDVSDGTPVPTPSETPEPMESVEPSADPDADIEPNLPEAPEDAEGVEPSPDDPDADIEPDLPEASEAAEDVEPSADDPDADIDPNLLEASEDAEGVEPSFDDPDADIDPDLAETPEAAEDVEPSSAPDADIGSASSETPQAMDNIVNILLMGIDAFEGGGTTSGRQPHTDVMMVVAVNFDKDTVDLITLPRDTFTTAPKYYGYYKLNAVFNVGGGMKDMESGFDLTRQAVEMWLGGITIPYYYALDFQAVIDVVDAIGGIDYDVDQPFRANIPKGKKMTTGKLYSKGMHHLDGNAVLGYLRIRKHADGKDSSRTARQRRMLVAIYTKLKKEGKLSQVPSLINAANSGIYTNTTLSQTASLANYALNRIEPDQIRTRTLSGTDMIQHYYKYCFVDQKNRIKIIKEVYGIDAEPIGVCTPQYENWLYDIGFKTMKHIRQPEKIFKVIEERKAAGKTFTEKQIAAYAACYQAYTALDEAFANYSEQLQKAYVDSSMTKKQISALENKIKKQLTTLNKNVQNTTTALARSCGITTKTYWDSGERWFADPDINEVRVYFG